MGSPHPSTSHLEIPQPIFQPKPGTVFKLEIWSRSHRPFPSPAPWGEVLTGTDGAGVTPGCRLHLLPPQPSPSPAAPSWVSSIFYLGGSAPHLSLRCTLQNSAHMEFLQKSLPDLQGDLWGLATCSWSSQFLSSPDHILFRLRFCDCRDRFVSARSLPEERFSSLRCPQGRTVAETQHTTVMKSSY